VGHAYGVDSPELYTYLYTVDYCNDPHDGALFDDMIYLDREILGEHTLAEVAEFIEARFKEHVHRVYTQDEIFQSKP
jgi:hypothetical protein